MVYKINCKDCNLGYVGQTSCFLKTRMSGHRSDIKLKKVEKSPLSEHTEAFKHTLDIENVSVLSRVDNGSKRLTVEMCYIKDNVTINRQLDLEKLNRGYSSILWKIKNKNI